MMSQEEYVRLSHRAAPREATSSEALHQRAQELMSQMSNPEFPPELEREWNWQGHTYHGTVYRVDIKREKEQAREKGQP